MARFFAVLWTLVLLYGMFTPGTGMPEVLSTFDKATHVAAFFVFAVLWAWALPGLSRARLRAVALLSLAFAAGTETLQAVLPIRRFGDPVDVVADLVGAAAGLAVAAVLLRRRKPS